MEEISNESLPLNTQSKVSFKRIILLLLKGFLIVTMLFQIYFFSMIINYEFFASGAGVEYILIPLVLINFYVSIFYVALLLIHNILNKYIVKKMEYKKRHSLFNIYGLISLFVWLFLFLFSFRYSLYY